jgi:hypothetical protein
MTKKETIWRYVLTEAISNGVYIFTQKDVAKLFGFSTSTTFNALKAPRKIGAIEVTGRNFRLKDKEKLLMLWATHRNLSNDILYSTHSDLDVRKIEGEMPADVIFAAYSAFRLSKNTEPPADYSEVYIYSADVDAVKKRFPPQKGYKNVFVLKPDSTLKSFGQCTPDSQTFVDIWNSSAWYSRDFLEVLKKDMNLIS